MHTYIQCIYNTHIYMYIQFNYNVCIYVYCLRASKFKVELSVLLMA